MITVLMQRHSYDRQDKAYAHFKMNGGFGYLPDSLHPEDQVKLIKRIVKAKENCTIVTHSLIVIYALNNELLRNKKLEIWAYEVLPCGKIKSVVKDRWIDESVLGHVADELHAEMNRLSAKRRTK